MSTSGTPTVIFDFDGTLALGHGPVLAYARCVAPHAPEGYLDRVDEGLRLLEAGSPQPAGSRPYRDGYHLVAELARHDGIDEAALSAAYLASRELLADAETMVTTLPDLAGFLTELRRSAGTVLATNAPPTGVRELLASWGVAELFDAVHFNVGKPSGLRPLITTALERGPVLSVGDILANDLRPAIELGADSALITRSSTPPEEPVTMRGVSLDALRGDILDWARQHRPPGAP